MVLHLFRTTSSSLSCQHIKKYYTSNINESARESKKKRTKCRKRVFSSVLMTPDSFQNWRKRLTTRIFNFSVKTKVIIRFSLDFSSTQRQHVQHHILIASTRFVLRTSWKSMFTIRFDPNEYFFPFFYARIFVLYSQKVLKIAISF